MSTDLATRPSALPEAVEQALIKGDLSALDTEGRLRLYHEICRSLGLNHLTQPFSYLTLNGRLVLYANRNCTDQLRAIQNVTLTITAREKVDDVYIVSARATLPSGRTDESIGAVSIAGLKGDNLANAFMKAETKSKRRVTLSVVGLSLLDELEVETIPGAMRIDEAPALPAPKANGRQPDHKALLDRFAAGFAKATALGLTIHPIDNNLDAEGIKARLVELAAQIREREALMAEAIPAEADSDKPDSEMPF